MPDPSGDSLPSSHEPPSASSEEPAHLTPAPRAHPPNVHHPRQAAKPTAVSPPAGLNEALEWMRLHGHLEDLAADLPGEPVRTRRSARSLLPKDQRKFHKFDPEHPQPSASEPVEVGSSRLGESVAAGANADDLSSPESDYPRGITSEQIAFMRRQRGEDSSHGAWFAVGVAGAVFLLVVVAFLGGHLNVLGSFGARHLPGISSQKSANGVGASGELSAGAIELIDQAMAAETARDFSKAGDLLEQAQHGAGRIYGSNYRRGLLAYEANDLPRARSLLDLSITEGEEVAASLSLRGEISNRFGVTMQGMSDLEKAASLDPFNAHYPFVWGEALRRAGKPHFALAQLKRAAERLQDPGLLGLYSMKLRLTQIELEQQDAFNSELVEKLKLNPPPIDWLMTAAATEMHRGDFPAAADLLFKVRAMIGEHETATWLQDIYFSKFAHEKLLTNFFEAAPTVP